MKNSLKRHLLNGWNRRPIFVALGGHFYVAAPEPDPVQHEVDPAP